MVTGLLILIALVLLFGAAAIRGAIAKIMTFVGLTIAGAVAMSWMGEGGIVALLWIALGLLVALWATVRFLDRPKPPPRPGQHTYVSTKLEKPDPATIKFSDSRPGKAERKRMLREYKQRTNGSASPSSRALPGEGSVDGLNT